MPASLLARGRRWPVPERLPPARRADWTVDGYWLDGIEPVSSHLRPRHRLPRRLRPAGPAGGPQIQSAGCAGGSAVPAWSGGDVESRSSTTPGPVSLPGSIPAAIAPLTSAAENDVPLHSAQPAPKSLSGLPADGRKALRRFVPRAVTSTQGRSGEKSAAAHADRWHRRRARRPTHLAMTSAPPTRREHSTRRRGCRGSPRRPPRPPRSSPDRRPGPAPTEPVHPPCSRRRTDSGPRCRSDPDRRWPRPHPRPFLTVLVQHPANLDRGPWCLTQDQTGDEGRVPGDRPAPSTDTTSEGRATQPPASQG